MHPIFNPPPWRRGSLMCSIVQPCPSAVYATSHLQIQLPHAPSPLSKERRNATQHVGVSTRFGALRRLYMCRKTP